MLSSSFDFDRALAYALSCVKQEGLCLKDQQVEAVKRLSEGKDVFVWFPTDYGPSYLTSSWVGPTLPSLTEVPFLLLFFPLVSDSTRILLSVSLTRIFIEIYNCFTVCFTVRFTVEFTIAPNTPLYWRKIGLGTRLTQTYVTSAKIFLQEKYPLHSTNLYCYIKNEPN